MIDVLQITQGRKLAALIEHTTELINVDQFLRSVFIEDDAVVVRRNNGTAAFSIRPIQYISSNLTLSSSEIILTKTNPTATVTFNKSGNGVITLQYMKNPKYSTEPAISPTYTLTSSQITFKYRSNTFQTLRSVYKFTVADTEDYVGSYAYLRVIQMP